MCHSLQFFKADNILSKVLCHSWKDVNPKLLTYNHKTFFSFLSLVALLKTMKRWTYGPGIASQCSYNDKTVLHQLRIWSLWLWTTAGLSKPLVVRDMSRKTPVVPPLWLFTNLLYVPIQTLQIFTNYLLHKNFVLVYVQFSMHEFIYFH